TAYSAMVLVYGPRSAAERLAENVRRRHESVRGVTAAGQAYSASDPELLNWVRATVSFGMVEAHRAFAGGLTEGDRERFYAEGARISDLFGASGAPTSIKDSDAFMKAMSASLCPNEAILEVLGVLRRAPILPAPFRPIQGLLVRGAIGLVPEDLRRRLALDRGPGLTRGAATALRALGGLVGDATPAAQSCLRLGLPADHLRRKATKTVLRA
ncbi:MAG TPA: oxygenase MpaB family protein, partial [Bauldia sp.]|nr:oxygenase MpaB family protein [Bauldia sp.]